MLKNDKIKSKKKKIYMNFIYYIKEKNVKNLFIKNKK